MVTTEAKRLLAIDARKLVSRTEGGKAGPENIGPMVLFTIAKRISRILPDRTSRILTERAVQSKAQTRTHSEMFGFKLSNLLTSVINRMDPESQRGLLFYVCGDAKQHGLAVLGLELLGESSGVEIAEKLLAWKASQIHLLDERDRMTMLKVKELRPQVRRLCNGALTEAAHALAEGDERSAQSWFMQVRKLVRRFHQPSPDDELEP
jgi:hypothetical protein